MAFNYKTKNLMQYVSRFFKYRRVFIKMITFIILLQALTLVASATCSGSISTSSTTMIAKVTVLWISIY